MTNPSQLKIDFSEPRMTAEERDVWNVLSMCRGRAMAILGPEIEALTGIGYKRIQKIINDLRCHHAKLIGSGTCGYYLPQTRKEFDDVCHYIEGRAVMALYTLSRIKQTSIEEIFDQMRLALPKAS
jgi:hypothetical protein